uniref:ATP synthase complex subunit 8 n=1 Tax=Leptopelis vermiculatus TaxID=39602 RepID=S4V177_9NEOB|nr:ATP synthase F0 subunit 8 [Leptopelis vermiculatus]
MPQLLPDPWFFLFIASWYIILTLIVPKIMKYKLFNLPQHHQDTKNQPSWHWPWP